MAECQWTDEQLQRIVRVAREHAEYAHAEGLTGAPCPNDVVVECVGSLDPPDPNSIGVLDWFATMAAWPDSDPSLQRLTWNIYPLSGALDDEGNAMWTWDGSDFKVVPDLDAVLLEVMLTEPDTDW